ncbi:MAG: hypothetical protein U0Y68_11410 [Blastocatellia bacterium]
MRKIYVPTEKVMTDLQASAWHEADVITFSGNGEPTLAANLGEAIQQIKAFTGEPIIVLTNATLLNDPAVRNDRRQPNKIFATRRGHRSHAATRGSSCRGRYRTQYYRRIKALRQEYRGHLAIQTMLLPVNENEITARRPA